MFKHLNISKVSNVVSRILLRFILLYPSIICIQLISTNRFEIELAGVFRETILSFELQTREPPKWFKNDDCFELLRVCIVCFFECIVYSIRKFLALFEILPVFFISGDFEGGTKKYVRPNIRLYKTV